MASFGASLAKAAGAGLLQYGQFKYQEQLDDKRAARLEQIEAMREANMAKREAARIEQADRHHKDNLDFQNRQLTAQSERTDKQLAAQERETTARLGLLQRQIINDMEQFKMGLEYKGVESLNDAFDSVDADYKAVEELVMKSRLDASGGMLTPEQQAEHGKKLDGILEEARKRKLTSYAGLFKSNPQLAQKSNRWGGQEHQLWQASESDYLKKLQGEVAAPSPTGPAAADPGKRNSRNEGGGDGLPEPAAGAEGADAALLRKAKETPAGLLLQGAKSLAGGIVDAGKTAVDDVAFVADGLFRGAAGVGNRIAYPATVARTALTTPINQEAATLARQIESEGDPAKRQQLLARLRQLQSN